MSLEIEQLNATQAFLTELQSLGNFSAVKLANAGAWFNRWMAEKGIPNEATIKDAARKYAEKI